MAGSRYSSQGASAARAQEDGAGQQGIQSVPAPEPDADMVT